MKDWILVPAFCMQAKELIVMNESKNISDYDIILLPYIAEIIASDQLTDGQREPQLCAIFKLRSILKYYANRRYLSKLINAIAEKKEL